ncbi:hypothetical protein [Parabacteroides sp. PF5-6]|uniref:hypothetical protein n=1 Tax=Parabacteroides sp. PF5-6 TaxID=1742403 RepID=UPI0024066059|nr:hypothetical protein [Parabacteroides sp. PF5-6]MDF9829145.1 uracil-DNA glycosylase [Parabacteroides sp. PF5-6]
MMKQNLTITITLIIMSIMDANGQCFFPFGQKLEAVRQIEKEGPKKVFVLGVYASAVHAKWISSDGKVLIKALAVASEPYIFWNGCPVESSEIISKINIPKELGTLVPADSIFNGPSGRSLDSHYLSPLNYIRDDCWLCDLIPHSCLNSSQKKALEREYDKYVKTDLLPGYNIPEVPKKLADENRIKEILNELKQSQAKKIILLGDQPIKYFLSRYSTYKKLTDFNPYGMPIKILIEDQEYEVLALAHPRQTSKLGSSNPKWYDCHQEWIKGLK